jgi:hypothetical protein
MSIGTNSESGTILPATQPMNAVAVPHGHRLLHLFLQRFSAFVINRALRAAEGELRTLNDRMLKDIGLERRDVEGILRECVSQRKSIDCGQRPVNGDGL